MAIPQPATMLPKELTNGSIELSHKTGAKIQFSQVKGSTDVTIVFLNGLMTDKTSWLPVIGGIVRKCTQSQVGFSSMLAYDRYGQGMTEDRDPQDQGREPGHGHDVADAAVDLQNLVEHVVPKQQHLLLVGNSIGCAIARLYAQEHPVAAVLLLDSIFANSNFDWWPNPDASDFDAKQLADDVTVDVLREQRRKFLAIFSPSTPNKEGLSRRNLPKLLPHSDRPPLRGEDGKGPFITVIGHNFDTFAEEGLRMMGTPKSLTMMYSNPLWNEYNEGLAKLTKPSYSKGPFQAPGCGHFIQRDNPDLVIGEILELVGKAHSEYSAVPS